MKARNIAGIAFSIAFTTIVAGRPARAQSLRPNILFIFDTSGSMAQSAAGANVGEDTNICPSGTGSKIYGLKSACGRPWPRTAPTRRTSA